MNQATNVTSLSFKWKKTTNVLRVSRRFWSPYSCNRSFCGRRCCKTSICISCSGSRWFPPPLLLNIWFLVLCISPFAMFSKSINSCTILFWGGLLTIHDSVYQRDALATGCLYCFNELTGCKFVWHYYLYFH